MTNFQTLQSEPAPVVATFNLCHARAVVLVIPPPDEVKLEQVGIQYETGPIQWRYLETPTPASPGIRLDWQANGSTFIPCATPAAARQEYARAQCALDNHHAYRVGEPTPES